MRQTEGGAFPLPSAVGCPCSQPRTTKTAKCFGRMRFSSFAADATIRTANKTAASAPKAAIPTEGEHATVLATVQGDAASRRPFGRPGRPLRAAAATALVRTEEWYRPRSNRGMAKGEHTERTINLPMNLVAADTREGEVYGRLLEKLETAREAFGGRVYNAHELLGIGRSSASSMNRARARSPRAIQVACRRLPLTFLPTTSRIIVRVSLAASSGGRAVSATLLTNLVMS